MDILTFISKVIDSLAWPSVAIALIIILRKEFPRIISSIRRFKYKDIEIEFDKSTREIDRKIHKAIPDKTKTTTLQGRPFEQVQETLLYLADIAPRSAILESWLLVETAAIHLLKTNNLHEFKSMPGPMRLKEYLVKYQVLNKQQIEIFERLRTLRNEAVHVADAVFTEESVHFYINGSLIMASYLESKTIEL